MVSTPSNMARKYSLVPSFCHNLPQLVVEELQVNEDVIVLLSERPEGSINILRSVLGETVDVFYFVIGGVVLLVA